MLFGGSKLSLILLLFLSLDEYIFLSVLIQHISVLKPYFFTPLFSRFFISYPEKGHSVSMWFPCMQNIRWPNSPSILWLSTETRLGRIRSGSSVAQIPRKRDYQNLRQHGYADLIRHSHAKNWKLDSLVPFMYLSSRVSARETSVSSTLGIGEPQRNMSNVY
jgi:hypothetical protein